MTTIPACGGRGGRAGPHTAASRKRPAGLHVRGESQPRPVLFSGSRPASRVLTGCSGAVDRAMGRTRVSPRSILILFACCFSLLGFLLRRYVCSAVGGAHNQQFACSQARGECLRVRACVSIQRRMVRDRARCCRLSIRRRLQGERLTLRPHSCILKEQEPASIGAPLQAANAMYLLKWYIGFFRETTSNTRFIIPSLSLSKFSTWNSICIHDQGAAHLHERLIKTKTTLQHYAS